MVARKVFRFTHLLNEILEGRLGSEGRVGTIHEAAR